MSRAELSRLTRVGEIVRRGRVTRIEAERIVFQSGQEIATSLATLHVDCSTNSTAFYTTETARPVWAGEKINLQLVLMPPVQTRSN